MTTFFKVLNVYRDYIKLVKEAINGDVFNDHERQLKIQELHDVVGAVDQVDGSAKIVRLIGFAYDLAEKEA